MNELDFWSLGVLQWGGFETVLNKSPLGGSQWEKPPPVYDKLWLV